MFDKVEIYLISISYTLVLFLIAYVGDKYASVYSRRFRPIILSLCLGIYFTAWTFYGTIGQAITKGWFIPPTFIGSIIVIAFCLPFIKKFIAVGKKYNSSSIADFISSHYGKSQSLAVLVTLVAIAALIPYFSLQLKAVSMTFDVLTSADAEPQFGSITQASIWNDTAFYVALIMAAFAIMFGTRHIDSKEHHDGLMLAIAFESVVKLLSFCAIGYYAGYYLNDGLMDLLLEAASNPNIQQRIDNQDSSGYVAAVVLGMAMVVCLPRLFHVLVVESNGPEDAETAQWVFPLYTIILIFFTLLLALSGLLFSGNSEGSHEFVFLALPVATENPKLSLLAYIGGLSAATSMVIIATITLATMICNDIVVPLLFRYRLWGVHQRANITGSLLLIRRITILVILQLAYFYCRTLANYSALGSIGLISLSLIAQLLPAIVGALYWPRGHKYGVFIGLALGFILWFYTMLLPTMIRAGWPLLESVLTEGLFGLGWLRPEALFNVHLDKLSNGVLWSLTLNTTFYIAVSLYCNRLSKDAHEQKSKNETLTITTLQKLTARFIGADQARLAILQYQEKHVLPYSDKADKGLIEYVETLLTGFIGAVSARRILELARKETNDNDAYSEILILETSQVSRFSRELLQTSIDSMRQGISVVDQSMQLVAWNKRYMKMFQYPTGMVHIGSRVDDLIRHNIAHHVDDPIEVERLVSESLESLSDGRAYVLEYTHPTGLVLEVQGNPMPEGGFVITYTDISEYTEVVNQLQTANETLEQRVSERTKELSDKNTQLQQAKSEADAANQNKTHFLAAASHDLLQPINASRLFLTALQQRQKSAEQKFLLDHLASSQNSAETLIHELLEIAKVDAGAVHSNPSDFSVDTLLASLANDFEIIAQEKHLTFKYHFCSQVICTDNLLLHRILQNLLANAVRYTKQGRIVLGCRRKPDALIIEVWDTGVGIPEQYFGEIFTEFSRLNSRAQDRGFGLGLATVQRLSKLLDHPIQVKSEVGLGSVFRVTVPLGKRAIRVVSTGENSLGGTDTKLANANILCIDNEQSILTGMDAMISNWGSKVDCHLSGDAAKNHIAQNTPPDVILADYHLDEGTTGISVVLQLRQYWGSNIPCIIISADRTDTVLAESKLHNFLFMQKPLKPTQLRNHLNKLLEEPR